MVSIIPTHTPGPTKTNALCNMALQDIEYSFRPSPLTTATAFVTASVVALTGTRSMHCTVTVHGLT
jgi:hypothetical protein